MNIQSVLQKAFGADRDRHLAYRVVCDELAQYGGFRYCPITEKVFYLYSVKDQHQVFPTDSTGFTSILQANFELDCTSYFTEGLQRYLKHTLAQKPEAKVRVTQVSAAANGNVYIHAGSRDGIDLVYRRTPGQDWEEVRNGEEGVLFWDPEKQPFRLAPGQTDCLDRHVLKRFAFDDSLMKPGHQYVWTLVFIVLAFLYDLVPARPFWLIQSEFGAGKTTFLRLLGRLLHGRAFDVRAITTEAAFLAQITGGGFFGFYDDVNQRRDFLAQRITEACTSVIVSLRKLYRTNTEFKAAIRTLLAFTSTGFVNTRNDTLSRCVVLELNHPQTRVSESELMNAVNENYDQIMTELLDLVGKVIDRWETAKPLIHIDFRFVDVAKIFYILCDLQVGEQNAQETFDEAQTETQASAQEALDKALIELRDAQLELLSRHESLIELIDLWLARLKTDPAPVTARELFRELRAVAEQDGIRKSLYVENPRDLGNRLNMLWPDLVRRFDASKKRRGKNLLHYTFRKPEDES